MSDSKAPAEEDEFADVMCGDESCKPCAPLHKAFREGIETERIRIREYVEAQNFGFFNVKDNLLDFIEGDDS